MTITLPAHPSRHAVLLGGIGLAGVGALSACTTDRSGVATSDRSFGSPTPLAPSSGQRVVTAALTPKEVTPDLGGTTVKTWAYGDTAPRLIRATAGDLLRVTVDNRLPADTSGHWHGIRLRNAADGVPGSPRTPSRPGRGSSTSSPRLLDPGTRDPTRTATMTHQPLPQPARPTDRQLPLAQTHGACGGGTHGHHDQPTPADTAAETAPPPALNAATPARTMRYPVAGMTCALCVRAVTGELTALDGVDTVSVELVPGGMSTVTVTVTGTGMPRRERIAQAVTAAGDYHLMPR